MPLLIYDTPKTIQYTQAILDFIILAQYISHDKEILCYIEHTLYKGENTETLFEYHQLIDSKLCQLTFNYPKFYAINYFVQFIWNYSSVVNQNTAYSKTAYKYYFKFFYNKLNKKEYDLQIRQYNVHHTNIIVIKNAIILEKIRKKEKLLKSIINKLVLTKVTQVSSLVDLTRRYKWIMRNADVNIVDKLELTGVKKYQ